MLRRVLAAAGLVAAGSVAYFYTTTIADPDVYALHGFERAAQSNAVRAGDIVAVWPDGQSFEPICDLNLDAETLHSERLADRYHNAFRSAIGDFRETVRAWAPVLVGGGADAATEIPRVVFVGEASSMREIDAAPALSRDCECRMAQRLNRREPVCTVKQSLIETTVGPDGARIERTVALTLARWSNFVPDEVFAACGLEPTRAAHAAMEQPCSTGSALPTDVVLRSFMNVIRREPLPPGVQAAAPGL